MSRRLARAGALLLSACSHAPKAIPPGPFEVLDEVYVAIDATDFSLDLEPKRFPTESGLFLREPPGRSTPTGSRLVAFDASGSFVELELTAERCPPGFEDCLDCGTRWAVYTGSAMVRPTSPFWVIGPTTEDGPWQVPDAPLYAAPLFGNYRLLGISFSDPDAPYVFLGDPPPPGYYVVADAAGYIDTTQYAPALGSTPCTTASWCWHGTSSGGAWSRVDTHSTGAFGPFNTVPRGVDYQHFAKLSPDPGSSRFRTIHELRVEEPQVTWRLEEHRCDAFSADTRRPKVCHYSRLETASGTTERWIAHEPSTSSCGGLESLVCERMR